MASNKLPVRGEPLAGASKAAYRNAKQELMMTRASAVVMASLILDKVRSKQLALKTAGTKSGVATVSTSLSSAPPLKAYGSFAANIRLDTRTGLLCKFSEADPVNNNILQIEDLPSLPLKKRRIRNILLVVKYPIVEELSNEKGLINVGFVLQAQSNSIRKLTRMEADRVLRIASIVKDLLKQKEILDRESFSALYEHARDQLDIYADEASLGQVVPSDAAEFETDVSRRTTICGKFMLSVEGDGLRNPTEFDPIVRDWLELPQTIDLSVGDPDFYPIRTDEALQAVDAPAPVVNRAGLIDHILWRSGRPNTAGVVKPGPIEVDLNELHQKLSSSSNRVEELLKLEETQNMLGNREPVITKDEYVKFIEILTDTTHKNLLEALFSALEMTSLLEQTREVYNYEQLVFVMGQIVKGVPKDWRINKIDRMDFETCVKIEKELFKMSNTLKKLGFADTCTRNEMLSMLRSQSKLFNDLEVKLTPGDELVAVPPFDVKGGIKKAKQEAKATSDLATLRAPEESRTRMTSAGTYGAGVAEKGGSKDSGYGSVHSHHSNSLSSGRSTYGDHSISGNESVKYVPTMPAGNIRQNVISAAAEIVAQNAEHVYWHDKKFKMSTVLTNPQTVKAQAKSTRKVDHFDRFVTRAGMPQPTYIKFTAPQVKDTMDTSLLEAVGTAAGVDCKKFVGRIQATIRCSRKYAEEVTCLLSQYVSRFNNSSLYAIAYVQLMMLEDMEREGIEAVFGVPVENAIVTINMAADQAHAAVQGDVTKEAMGSGRVFLNAEGLTQKDFSCMKLISSGPSVVSTGPNSAHVHIGSTISGVGGVKWAVYDDRPVVINEAIERVTSADMAAFLTKLQSQMKDTDAMACGFTQATCLINGKVMKMSYNGENIIRYVMSTLEIGQINMPQPSGHNFLWRVIEIEPLYPNSSVFEEEAKTLRGLSLRLLNYAGVVVASSVSLGVSGFLHYVNISGYDLNCSVLPAPNENMLGNFVRELVEARGQHAAPLLVIACGFICQFSNMSISPLSFAGRHWNNNLNGVRSLLFDELDLWCGVWKRHIPYLLDPLATAFMLKRWPDIYLVMAPEVKFDVSLEINMLGPQHLRCWSATSGCSEYNSTCAGSNPYTQVPYGGMVINALRQHYDPGNDWVVHFRVYKCYGKAVEHVYDTVDFQPEYDPDFGIIKIGTLLTYTWDTNAVLAPTLRADIGEGIFSAMSACAFHNLTSAGLYLPYVQTSDPLISNVGGIATLVGGNEYLGFAGLNTASSFSAEN
ncbi:MAG: hypothetical protein FuToV7_gp1 [Hangzhou totivirus 7]|nr:MAG: hypothetical protein FuToV7_gp1 [Hangzhou totivirus 7]